MDAGWMVTRRSQIERPDIPAALRAIEPEVPVPMDDYAGGTPLHLSEAIAAVQRGVAKKVGGEETLLHETLAYSTKVNATYLLEEYGLPDEARRLYPFERPQVRNGPSFDGAQLIRYDELVFLISDQGEVRYLMLATAPSL